MVTMPAVPPYSSMTIAMCTFFTFISASSSSTFEENEDYDTLGGYLIGQLGHIPEEGETIEMKLCGWLFSVELFEEKRILKVLATKLPEEEKEEAEAEEKADEE